MTRRRTKLVRIYVDDERDIRSVFGNVRMADFLHIGLKSNFFLAAEAMLRGKNVKKRK